MTRFIACSVWPAGACCCACGLQRPRSSICPVPAILADTAERDRLPPRRAAGSWPARLYTVALIDAQARLHLSTSRTGETDSSLDLDLPRHPRAQRRRPPLHGALFRGGDPERPRSDQQDAFCIVQFDLRAGRADRRPSTSRRTISTLHVCERPAALRITSCWRASR